MKLFNRCVHLLWWIGVSFLLGVSQDHPPTFVFAIDQSGSMVTNDRNFEVPVAVTNSINSIAELSPNSLVGYFGFANGICDGNPISERRGGKGPRFEDPNHPLKNTVVHPKIISDSDHHTLLLLQTGYTETDYAFDCGSDSGIGTVYYNSFELARDMFETVRINYPGRPEILFFITDGEPTRNSESQVQNLENFNNMADSVIQGWLEFPRLHSTFINGNYYPLTDLTLASGGMELDIEDFTDSDLLISTLPVVRRSKSSGFQGFPVGTLPGRYSIYPWQSHYYDVQGKAIQVK